MYQVVDAIYEHGVLRPLEPLEFAESERVRVTITSGAPDERDLTIKELAQREVAGIKHIPSIEEVRAALASVPGSMADDVIAERGDY